MTDILYTIGAETKGVDQADSSLNKLEKTVLDNVRAVERFERDHKKLDRAFNQGRINAQQYALGHQQLTQQFNQTTSAAERQVQTLERNAATMQRGQRVTLATGSSQQVLRQRFLETANSIAILDGPLGGVASRFSSFGVLVGRTGVVLAGFLTTFAAFGFALRRGIVEANDYERSMARISAVLETTGSQAGLTASQIDGLAESIAVSSLQSSQAVREAAGQLLTFGSVAGEVFPEVLRLAADMAALGFGTLQSESSKLAKAIEDPRQSLTSLSRSGITFTRDQRAVILSLVETGREAEATARILETVRNQVGGAASREAQTFSGSIDTITQAYGRLFRQLGEFVTREDSLLGRGVRGLADRAEQFIEGQTPLFSAADIEREQEQLRQTELLIRDGQRRLQQLNKELSEAGLFDSLRIAAEIGKVSSEVQRLFSDVERSKTLIGDGLIENIPENVRAIERLNESILDLELSIQSAVQDSGQTSFEAFVNSAERAARATGLVDDEVRSLSNELRQLAGIQFVVEQASALENNLRRATDAFQDSNAAAQAQLEFIGQTGREVQVLIGLRERELQVQAQIEQLQNQLTNASGENATAIQRQISGLMQVLENYRAAANEAARLANETDRAASSASALANIMSSVAGAISGARAQVVGMNAEIAALGSGMSIAAASGIGGVAQQVERLIEQADQITDPVQYAQAMEAINELHKTGTELAVTRAEAQDRLNAALAGARGGGGSGGGGAGRGAAAQSAMDRLLEEIELQRQRIGLNEEELRLFEARLRVTNAARQDGIALGQEEIDVIAQQIVQVEKQIEQQERLRQAQERAAERMTNLFMAATKGGDAFKQALGNIIQELARMAAMRAFQSIAGSLFGGGSLAPTTSPRPPVRPFAKGGVVDGPTMFPMKGATGLMGEAGPEAIIPLKRGRDGSLGVQGGMTNAVSVTYAPQINVKGSGEEVTALRQEIAKMNAEAPARIISTIQKAQKKRVL